MLHWCDVIGEAFNFYAMNKYLFSLLLLTVAIFHSTAQSYWQQEVNYTISVKLDDKNHVLHGQESFVYINNSPQTLDFLYIHLWPNAYRSGKTALGKQQYADGEQELTFGADSIKGSIDSLSFTVDGVPTYFEYDAENPDIAKLVLVKPLISGARITVSTPFKVKIPSGEISRLGHIGQSYQITQWYPKPAVYDKNGWNQMPYLNQGEFYSEYGSFDVSITLPKNYVVGATGDLQTQSEIDFLNKKAGQSDEEVKNASITAALQKQGKKETPFPPSDAEWKTIRYTQKNVHDFAWFADKRYIVLKGEVELPQSKRKVTSWAMFVPHNVRYWQNAIEYINDGTYYYSKWNGDYPYNNVTAVDGTISAGGGMEYPNVTVIGNAGSAMELEIVIVHEVGHNWFYGILGSNERVHGWMDEGMNTLNELRYVYTKYPNNTNLSDMVLGGRFHFDHLDHYDMADFTYRGVAGFGEDQPIETHSADFTSINYGAVMYSKTGLVFTYLKQYLGDEEFDRCMHAYYEKWKFKHPQPEDMRAVLEKESGKDLGWLFDDLIQTTNHIDYKLTKVTADENGTTVTVKNTGQVNGPIEVGAYQKGKLVETVWAEPAEGKSTVVFKSEADEVRVNPSGRIPEVFRDNNNWHQKGLFGKVEPLKLEGMIGDNEQGKSNVFWMPMIAANQNDRFMLGAAIHNFGVPFNRVQYLVVPMYSFGGKRISGMADISYSFLPKKNLKLSKFGVAVRSFKETDSEAFKGNDGYYFTASPFWFAKLGNRKEASPISQTLLVQSMYRLDVFGRTQIEQVGGFAKYDFNYNKPDHEINVGLRSDFISNVNNGDQMGRSSIEATYRFRYIRNESSRWVELRGYAGGNWLFDFGVGANTAAYSLNLSGANGSQDLFIEDYYFGRTATQGFLSQQRLENMGGFKSTSDYGTNSKWVTAANFYAQLPFVPGIFGVFADAGFFPSALNNQVLAAYDFGLGIRLGKVAGLYFPLYISKDMDDAYGTLNYTTRIRFTLRMSITNRGINFTNLM
ncbi:MAG TPA: M1 family metallopeptidase [Fluviicola sp.]|nr:M1 family metallopeptidase [Fluviicola sp.]